MATALGEVPAAATSPLELWVDGGSPACSDAGTREQAASVETPWCSVVRAAAASLAGDTVHIEPGVYVGTVRPAASGSVGAPIRFVADTGGVTIDAGGASAAIKLVSVADIVIDGITVTGAAVQGIWAYGAQRITLTRVTVVANGGPGIQVRDSTAVTVSESDVSANGGAGIFETSGTSGGRYVGNDVQGNGIDGYAYNGDGMQLDGGGAYVAGNTIIGNGDPGPYEHGIYLGSTAHDFLVEDNVLRGNAGSDIKVSGAAGVVRYNHMGGGRLGMVFSDNASPVLAYYNVVAGVYQHAVLVTTDISPARAVLWNNTLVVTARKDVTGDGSAVFVKAAASLDLRNNLISYANADGGGAAVYVVDSRQVATLTSNNDWFSTLDPKGHHLVWNGVRLNLSRWQRNGQDGKSIASSPPQLDSEGRVVSADLGRRRGQIVGLTRDIVGTALPSGVAPDIGAFQAA